jgi:hypothetical protein
MGMRGWRHLRLGGKLFGAEFLDGMIPARGQHALGGTEFVESFLAYPSFFLSHQIISFIRLSPPSAPLP